MKRFLTTVLFLALAANVFAYPDKPTLGWSQVGWGWNNGSGTSVPFAATASGAAIISTEGTTGLTVATMPTITVSPGTYTPALEAGSETIGLFWDAPLATPTITTTNAATTATVTNAAKRAYIIIQNQGATETVYVYTGATATPGESIAVYAGGSITRPWGSDVQVSYAASTTTQIVIDQEVRP